MEGLEIGRRVRVHMNLHRGDFSVLDPKTGRVITNVDHITLSDVVFRVGEAARQRTIRNNRRKVMAYAIGYIVDVNVSQPLETLNKVTYNPFRCGAFHRPSGEEVWCSPEVHFSSGYCWTREKETA